MPTKKMLLFQITALIGFFTLSGPALAQRVGPLGLNAVQVTSQDTGLTDANSGSSSTAACRGKTQPLPPQLLDQLERQGPGSSPDEMTEADLLSLLDMGFLPANTAAGGSKGNKLFKGNKLNVSASPFTTLTQGEGFSVSWDGNVGEDYKLCWKKTGTVFYDCASPHVSATNSNTWSGKTYAGIFDLDCDTEYKIKVKRVGGIGWSKVKETTNPCSCADPCPQGGYYDGANCQIGEAPTNTTAFIYANNFYYTPVPTGNCPYPGSYWDTANCKVSDVPPGATGFIWANHWYYAAYPSTSDPCPHGGYYDSANCQIGEAPWGTEAFIYNGSYYYTALPECPYPGSVYDSANCYVQPVPPGTNGFIWLNHWYYESCP
ncbi:MAG: hypothetical protein VCE43_24515 [Myxococcota bacterium]